MSDGERPAEVETLLAEVRMAGERISEVVGAVKSYAYLDQAPVQNVDVHEGLESTLVILQHKLKHGVMVKREYSPDLPRIEAYASELNQVWTNLIDNAIKYGRGAVLTVAPLLADEAVQKVFHASEYDVMCLRRDFGFAFRNLFDTMWAARILGWQRVGLGDILQEQFGVTLDKKWQRHNWGKRPIEPAALAYAQFDTHYLLRLRDVQLRELQQLDRLRDAPYPRVVGFDPARDLDADASAGRDSTSPRPRPLARARTP